MNKFNFKHSLLTLSCLTLFHAPDAPAASLSRIDKQREESVILSRQGDEQLNRAITQLTQLYTDTRNNKVRDDLIALLMRKGDFKQVLNVCPHCNINTFSANELENLARAARNEKQFQLSYNFYSQLRQQYPSNPNGLLGSALVATESGKYQEAQHYLRLYSKQFGQDAGYRDAADYLADHTEADISKLGRWQKALATQPDNKDLALRLYRLAAKYRIYPLQSQLTADYPDLFSDKDRAWQDHAGALNVSRGNAASKSQLNQSYAQLTKVLETQEKTTALYQQALQDRLVIAQRLHNSEQVFADYATLSAAGKPLPAYVDEAYADALLRTGSPFKALEIYQKLAQQERQNNQKVRSDLLYKLVNASSDAGYFTLAQDYLDQINEPLFINDYTRKYRIVNNNYDTLFFARVNLTHWRGNTAEAVELLTDRLTTKTPGDPWTMMALSELERSRYRYDDALILAKKASRFLRPQDQKSYQALRANILLDRGDWQGASEIIAQLSPQDKEDSTSLLERYALLSAPKFTASFGIQHKTFPQDNQSNEVSQEYYLYSGKSQNGHQAYVHYLANNSPTREKNLKQQRIGAGGIVNF
uniref:poly-beta-1,6 N-acetyl-D-glucosamine export porin PgaA n=1 Tax=Actinobacillus succinogenes TaxID=67854 RepID=UPI00356571ED